MAPLWFTKTVYENHTNNDYYCATEDFCGEKCMVQSRKDDFFKFPFFAGERKLILSKINYLSQYLTNLMHKISFTISFISCLYMFRAHVLIIRRSKLHYTASGIITTISVLETCRGMK